MRGGQKDRTTREGEETRRGNELRGDKIKPDEETRNETRGDKGDEMTRGEELRRRRNDGKYGKKTT